MSAATPILARLARMLPQLGEGALEAVPREAIPEFMAAVKSGPIRDLLASLASRMGLKVAPEVAPALVRPAAAAAPEMVQPAISDPMYAKLSSLSRQFLREPSLAIGTMPPVSEAAPLIPEFEGLRAQLKAITPPPSPAGYQPKLQSMAEMSMQPQGAEREQYMQQVKDLLAGIGPRGGGMEEIQEPLARLQAILQKPGKLPSEVSTALNRIRGTEPEIAPFEGEVTKIPYRGQPYQQPANVPPEKAFVAEGLKRTTLLPEHQEMLRDLIASGKLPADVLEQKNTLRKLYAELYGYKPKMLAGSTQEIAEAEAQSPGVRFLQQFSQMTPEEIIEYLRRSAQSGFLPKASKLAQMTEASQQAAGQYRALGEKTPAAELAPLLLRGELPAGSEFAQNVLYPVAKRREKLGLGPGQPLLPEQLLAALRTSEFLRPRQPSAIREAFIQRVLAQLKQRMGGQ